MVGIGVDNVHPKYIQELLGHANIAITLDTYSHVIPGMGDHVARAMRTRSPSSLRRIFSFVRLSADMDSPCGTPPAGRARGEHVRRWLAAASRIPLSWRHREDE